MKPEIQIGNKLISKDGNDVYIVAEIGQNHQGSIKIAKQMILEAKHAGCDCVKFQKSHLSAKFTESALNRSYTTRNSFGRTYGEHKIYLEFSLEEFKELQDFCKKHEIDFTASAMDEISLEYMGTLDVPFIKIGSGDTNNFPLIRKAAKMSQPMVISTGMQSMSTLDSVVKIMHLEKKYNFALLHCVSSYPTEASDANLQMITLLRHRFPDCVIGYSGHEIGINLSLASVLLGAKIIERHFTLDKNQKGSDHKCSLDPPELKQLIEKIRNLQSNKELTIPSRTSDIISHLGYSTKLEQALKMVVDKKILPCELSCKAKLGKSLVAARNLLKGTKLQPDHDLCVKVSEPNGIAAEHYFELFNAILKRDVYADEIITYDVVHLKETFN